MQSAIERTGDIGHARRLAASLMAATAAVVGGLYNGVGVSLFVRDKLAWLAVAAAGGVAVWIAWSLWIPRRRDRHALDLAAGLIAWITASVLIIYAVAKVFGGQFGPPMQSELDTPLRDLSGFQLTWRFFGYSYAYTLFVAGGQLAGAVLLCFGRTRLLGACVLAPIMANIVVLNVTHGIPVKLLSTLLFVLDLYLIAALGGRRLLAFFCGGEVSPRPRGPTHRRVAAIKASVVVAYVLYVGAAHRAAQKRWYQPSPLHGTWQVVEVSRDGAGAAAIDDWERVYFENYRRDNRHLGAARSPAGLTRFAYVADAETRSLRIELALKRLDGHFERSGRRVTIRGTFGPRGEARPIAVELERIE